MSKTFVVKILTPNRIVISEEIERLLTNTSNGKLEFLANFEPTIVSTEPCITTFYDGTGNKKELFTSRGTINVSNKELIFCCEAAELPEDIDIERAKSAKERAEGKLKDKTKYDIERAVYSLLKANIRMDLKKHR